MIVLVVPVPVAAFAIGAVGGVVAEKVLIPAINKAEHNIRVKRQERRIRKAAMYKANQTTDVPY